MFWIQCLQLSICDSCFKGAFVFHIHPLPFVFPTSLLKVVILFICGFFLWLLICWALRILLRGILGSKNLPHLSTYSRCFQTFPSPAMCAGFIYGWKMKQPFTTASVLFASLMAPGFILFYVNWVTDVLLLRNALKLFHMFSGKRSLSKVMLK